VTVARNSAAKGITAILTAIISEPGPRLPYFHINDMDFHMKTTLNIDDQVMHRLRQEAARQGRTMSEMVETALRLHLRARGRQENQAALPSFRSGGLMVDIADRDALYEAMERR
jgi:plasmid stability protein